MRPKGKPGDLQVLVVPAIEGGDGRQGIVSGEGSVKRKVRPS